MWTSTQWATIWYIMFCYHVITKYIMYSYIVYMGVCNFLWVVYIPAFRCIVYQTQIHHRIFAQSTGKFIFSFSINVSCGFVFPIKYAIIIMLMCALCM